MAKGKGRKSKRQGQAISRPDASKKSMRMKRKKKSVKATAENAVPVLPASIANDVGAASPEKEMDTINPEQHSGFIFMCDMKTKPECFQYHVFGLPAGKLEVVEKIKEGTKLFLFDFNMKLLHGVYEATCHGQMNLEASAFGGRFPAQVKFSIFEDCIPLPESTFKSAVKDNYHGSKFEPELDAEQVSCLLSLFRSCDVPTAPPFKVTTQNAAPAPPAPAPPAPALITNGVGAASEEMAANVSERISGFIFMCDMKTKPECFRHRVFGLPAVKKEVVGKIKEGTKLFLFDFNMKLLYGVYKATCHGQMNLEASAFGGRFPAQVKFSIFKDCIPLPESTFKRAIKDNYHGSKFEPELNAEQASCLLSLFRSCDAPPAAPFKVNTQNAVPAPPSPALITNGVGAASEEVAMHVSERISGFIFMCDMKTKPECFRHRVFGLPAVKKEVVEKIKEGTKLFLFDFNVKLLYGVYKATCHGQMNLEASAFRGRFPAQVKFSIFKDCMPLPESAFKSAIKDNYRGSKFKPELDAKQVRGLLSLFRSCDATAVPMSPYLAREMHWQDICQPRSAIVPPLLHPFMQPEFYGSAGYNGRAPPAIEHQGMPAHPSDRYYTVGNHKPYLPGGATQFLPDQYPRYGGVQEVIPRIVETVPRQPPLMGARGPELHQATDPRYYNSYPMNAVPNNTYPPTPGNSYFYPPATGPRTSYSSFPGANQVYH